MGRDFKKNPYSKDEGRVCDAIQKVTDGAVGCGDDPIGFLIASWESQARIIRTETVRRMLAENERDRLLRAVQDTAAM